MKSKDIIKGLQNQGVRTVWLEEEEKWYLAVVDLIRLLTESKQPKAYWQNLRDHMTEAELIFTALAEMAVRQIAEGRDATGYEENAISVEKGAGIAGKARKQLEKCAGRKVVTDENFRAGSDDRKK